MGARRELISDKNDKKLTFHVHSPCIGKDCYGFAVLICIDSMPRRPQSVPNRRAAESRPTWYRGVPTTVLDETALHMRRVEKQMDRFQLTLAV